MARDDSYLLKISLALTVFGAAFAVRSEMPSESFKLLFVGTGAALLLPNSLQNWRALPISVRITLLIWLIGIALSMCFALDPLQALMGSYERAQGALCMVLCLTLALARVPREILTPIVAGASTVVSLWACTQALGLEKWLSYGQIHWQHADGFGDRVFAGFGNPVNLGNWLCIALSYLLTQLRGSDYRWRLSLPCALAALALCLSGARAAMLAALIATITVYWSALSRSWRIGGAVVFLFTALTLVCMPTRTASIEARLTLWQSATAVPAPLINSLAQPDPYPSVRFWLGFGQDLQSAALTAAAPNLQSQFADRAHNAVLDLWLCTGIWGLGSGLLLAAAIWRTRTISGAVLPIILAAGVTWSVSFGLSADKSLFALILGSQWSVANGTSARATSPMVAFSFAIVLLCWLSYRPLPYGAPASDYVLWRKPEQAIAHFRAGQALFFTQPRAAAQSFGLAQNASPWRQDLAKATRALQESKQ